MFFILFAIAVALAVAADLYDVILTEKGLKAGVAVEGNSFLLGETNTKPTALQLYRRDAIVIAMASAPALAVYLMGAPDVAYGFLAGPVVAAIKHIQGGRAWAKLLAGGKLSTAPKSAWQKFWGI